MVENFMNNFQKTFRKFVFFSLKCSNWLQINNENDFAVKFYQKKVVLANFTATFVEKLWNFEIYLDEIQ